MEAIYNWFLGLGEAYGVNPFVFGMIYVGAIPFFSLSVGWLIRNYRRGRAILLPAISALFFFISAYIYLIIAGRNVAVWVYGVILMLVVIGAYSAFARIKREITKSDIPVENE